jgi:serine/threonine protein kinase
VPAEGGRYTSCMPLSAGQTFAGFTVLKLLGSGGMGEVYLVDHPRLPRREALKILPAAATADSEFRQRFNREADLAATLWHPHIVAVHDRGEFNGQLWITMDYVEGTDAAARVRDRYPAGLPEYFAAEIVSAVADALDYAHEQRRGDPNPAPSPTLGVRCGGAVPAGHDGCARISWDVSRTRSRRRSRSMSSPNAVANSRQVGNRAAGSLAIPLEITGSNLLRLL